MSDKFRLSEGQLEWIKPFFPSSQDFPRVALGQCRFTPLKAAIMRRRFQLSHDERLPQPRVLS